MHNFVEKNFKFTSLTNCWLITENKSLYKSIFIFTSPVGWGCRIRQPHLCKVPPRNKCLGYDTKPSDGAAPVPELWAM